MPRMFGLGHMERSFVFLLWLANYSRVEQWRGIVQEAAWPSPPSPVSCPFRSDHQPVSTTPSSNRTGPFRSSGSPTVFTARLAADLHNFTVESVNTRLLEEGGMEFPKSLSMALVLSPQEVHPFRVDKRIYLLEMPVGVADTKILTPALKNWVYCLDLLFQTVSVIVPNRIADPASDALHRLRGWPTIAVLSLGIAPIRLEPEMHPQEVESLCGIDCLVFSALRVNPSPSTILFIRSNHGFGFPRQRIT